MVPVSREMGWVVGVAVDTACAVSSSVSVGGIGSVNGGSESTNLEKIGPKVLVVFVITTQ